MKLIILELVILGTIKAEVFRYDNYTLFKLTTKTQEQYFALKKLYDSNKYDFWNAPSRNIDTILVVSSPESKEIFLNFLKQSNIENEVVNANIQEEFVQQKPRRHKRDVSRTLFWTNYQLLEDIYDWFDQLAEANPGVLTVIEAGRSHENRIIKGVKISRATGKRAFFLEGGMIGADWLSPVTLTYLVNELVNSESSETRQASLDYDWYIVPVTNPDGYIYSQDAVRLWTKNRRPLGDGNFGVDLTKNWNSHWGVNGSSYLPSSGVYAGHGPFSEVETRTLSEYIATVPRLYGFLSFRATMQKLVIPFAHTPDHVYNYDEMILVGGRAMGALRARYDTQYLVGNSMEVLDGATGSAADWAKHRFNPPIVATYQMRDLSSGYTLPVAQVQPNCEEVFDSVLALVREGREANLGN